MYVTTASRSDVQEYDPRIFDNNKQKQRLGLSEKAAKQPNKK